MKKVIFLFVGALILVSCAKDDILPASEIDSTPILLQSRAIPTPYFNWETVDWMPTPPGQPRISPPWTGAGSLLSFHGLEIVSDRRAIDGWEMLYSTFDPSGPQIQNPCFVLYNKYRGIMRLYFYLTTEFVTTSSYLQDVLSIVSSGPTSPMLRFLGNDFIDATSTPPNMYAQMQPATLDGSPPLGALKWYMVQYELAYDPNIRNVSNAWFNWSTYYHNVTDIKIGGEFTGTIYGTVGAASPSGSNLFSGLGSSVSNVAQVAGTGALAAVGSGFIANKERTPTSDNRSNNTLGLDNGVYNSLKSGISSALSSATSNLPGAALKLLSAIIGGSGAGGVKPISLTLNAQLDLRGTGSSSGLLPSMPRTFLVPGSNIPSNAVGYMPLYNKPLGVINFNGKPVVQTSLRIGMRRGDDPYTGIQYVNETYTLSFPQNIDYSSSLVINPEVSAIADINILKQELVLDRSQFADMIFDVPSLYWEEGYDESGMPPWQNQDVSAIGVRFTIEVKPKNSSAPSSVIIKTFALSESRSTTYDFSYHTLLPLKKLLDENNAKIAADSIGNAVAR